MKRQILLLVIVWGISSISMMAQDDDLYFVPKKHTESATFTKNTPTERSSYYLGSNRDIDEYNRRPLRSQYQSIDIDSLGNDVISFTEGDGSYPDTITIYVEDMDDYNDYLYSRRMGRFDGFYGWYDPFFYGYWGWGRPYWNSFYWDWYDPWYYGYAGWYTPWYYGYGWRWPYYYGYNAGWYGHYYYGSITHGGNPRGFTGDRTWSFNDSKGSQNMGTFNPPNSSGRDGYTHRSTSNRSFGSRTYNNSNNSNSNRGTYNDNSRSSGTFGSNRPSTPPSSYSSSSRSSGFGGGHVSRGGGQTGGGGRSGGSFGGRR